MIVEPDGVVKRAIVLVRLGVNVIIAPAMAVNDLLVVEAEKSWAVTPTVESINESVVVISKKAVTVVIVPARGTEKA